MNEKLWELYLSLPIEVTKKEYLRSPRYFVIICNSVNHVGSRHFIMYIIGKL